MPMTVQQSQRLLDCQQDGSVMLDRQASVSEGPREQESKLPSCLNLKIARLYLSQSRTVKSDFRAEKRTVHLSVHP